MLSLYFFLKLSGLQRSSTMIESTYRQSHTPPLTSASFCNKTSPCLRRLHAIVSNSASSSSSGIIKALNTHACTHAPTRAHARTHTHGLSVVYIIISSRSIFHWTIGINGTRASSRDVNNMPFPCSLLSPSMCPQFVTMTSVHHAYHLILRLSSNVRRKWSIPPQCPLALPLPIQSNRLKSNGFLFFNPIFSLQPEDKTTGQPLGLFWVSCACLPVHSYARLWKRLSFIITIIFVVVVLRLV